MSYYDNGTIEANFGSFKEDKILDYAHNWKKDNIYEGKRVKIIKSPDIKNLNLLEEKINNYLEEQTDLINIIDIKYLESSVLIIYEIKLK